MTLITDHILTWITFLPLLGGVLVLLSRHAVAARWIALVTSLVDLALSIQLWLVYDAAAGTDQFVERAAWLFGGKVQYHLACDGISQRICCSKAICRAVTREALSVAHPSAQAREPVLRASSVGHKKCSCCARHGQRRCPVASV